VHVRAMLDFQKAGVPTVDYGNNIRQVALEEGVKNAFDFPGFVPQYIRPLFCRGVGPFRWVALSGDPEDIYRTDEAVMALSARISAEKLAAKVGSNIDVILDRVDGEGGATGRSKADAPEIDGEVHLRDAGGLNPGDIVATRVEDSDEHDLYGVPL